MNNEQTTTTAEAEVPAKAPRKARKAAKAAGKGKAPAKTAKPAKAARKGKTAKPAKAKAPKAESKKGQLLAMVQRAKGASTDELIAALGWQKHTLRAAISRIGGVESTKDEKRGRVYKLPA